MELDLHGYYKNEALMKVDETIEMVGRTGEGVLEVITGKGIHSSGPPVLRPAVIKHIEEKNLRWSPVFRNSGRIKVYVNGERSAEASYSLKQETGEAAFSFEADNSNVVRTSFEATYIETSETQKPSAACATVRNCLISTILITVVLLMMFCAGRFVKLF